MKKYIFLNLKRFDIPKERAGVNAIAPAVQWAPYIVSQVQKELAAYQEQAEFAAFFPEAHVIPAAAAMAGPLHLGCQAVYREDVAPGGNFGAFTSLRTAQSMAALGCDYTIIGHCEERKNLKSLYSLMKGTEPKAINAILNQEILCAQKAGMTVLYCIGENADEVDIREEVLSAQLREGLAGTDLSKVVIAYEPLWAIGPGRPVPTAEEIQTVARFVKSVVNRPIVYGGGLKEENAQMIASIPEMDGGLIALTRFQGEIGFYPDEYLRIIRNYLG